MRDSTPWRGRIEAANALYKNWETQFKCDKLDDYVVGKQWNDGDERYVLNMFAANIDIKTASLGFGRLEFNLKPKPTRMDFNPEMAMRSAQIKQDVLNTILNDPDNGFQEEVEICLQDSFTRFGLMEVGYSASWVTNPDAPKPITRSDTEENVSEEDDEVVEEPEEIPENERVYFRAIDPRHVRIGGAQHYKLSRCGWIGFYDYYYLTDVKEFDGFDVNAREALEYGSHRPADEDIREVDRKAYRGETRELVKLWHIFDLRTKTRILWAEHEDTILKEEEFQELPLLELSWRKQPSRIWYPVPPAFDWIWPQIEYNESRDQLSTFRKRMTRKFQVMDGGIDEDELEKFETGGDGALVKVKVKDGIQPIQDPTINSSVRDALILSKDDMNYAAGTSAEARGQADRMTATQTAEIAKRTGIRENKDKERFARFITAIGRLTLWTIQTNFTDYIWYEISPSPDTQIGMAVQTQQKTNFGMAAPAEIMDDIDFSLDVNITATSPMDVETEKAKFIEFLSLSAQFPQIGFSPLLIQEAAFRVGYRNMKVIAEMQNMALLAGAGLLGQQAAAAGPKGDQFAQQINAQNSPPTAEQARNQSEKAVVQ